MAWLARETVRALAMTAAALAVVAAAPPRYEIAAAIPGPDGAGWDYAKVDQDGGHLFVAHGDSVMVVDLAHGSGARSIGRISHGHAVVPIPGSTTLVVTSGGDSTVRIFDVPSGRQIASLPVGEDPDAAILDPATGHVLTMNAKAGSVSEIDVATRTVVRTIAVKPALEYAAIGPDRTLFINNEDTNELEVVDLGTGKLGAPIALTGCEGPTGLAYDARHRRLISACANGVAAVVDAIGRHVVQLVPIGRGPDAVLLDDRRGVALIPCGKDGVLDVLAIAGAGKIDRLAEVATEPGARTGAVDPVTGTIYLPTARFGPPAAPGKRPPALPGSFHVVVVRPT